MPETPTPGETAYTAYWPALGSADPPVPWDGLAPVVHRAWEAAAQAVLAQGSLLAGLSRVAEARARYSRLLPIRRAMGKLSLWLS